MQFIGTLKAKPGGDIHLSGGAGLAQSMVRLRLVDAFNFYVFPTVSPGASWFGEIADKRDMELVSATAFESGVVGLSYRARAAADMGAPVRFTELLGRLHLSLWGRGEEANAPGSAARPKW